MTTRLQETQPHAPDMAKGLIAGAIGGCMGSIAAAQFTRMTVRLRARSKGRPGENHESTDEQVPADPPTHYVLDTLIGGAYGALAEVAPITRVGMGVPFAAALWLSGDEAVEAPTEKDFPGEAAAHSSVARAGGHLHFRGRG